MNRLPKRPSQKAWPRLGTVPVLLSGYRRVDCFVVDGENLVVGL